jgi:Calcineurin-like phosphoesterase
MWRRLAIVALVALVAGVVVGSRDEEKAGHEAAASNGLAPPVLSAAGRGRATVWAVGDGADGRAAAKAVAARIATGRVDRFLYLGDVYDSGRLSEFELNYAPVYARFGTKTAPTPGNHDWPHRAEGYNRYWAGVFGKPIPAYFSFWLAGWRIFSLNSETEHDAGSSQLAWLRKRLRGRSTCRLAFWHRPRFSAGKTHGDQADVAPFWDALRRHAVLVVNGHEHDMQRLKRDGLVELVSGAGGHGHHGIDSGDTRPAFADDEHYGALRLELQPGRARFAFVAADGRTLDSGLVRCRTR